TSPGYSQQLAEESHGRNTVTLRLDQNINDHTILIDGAPEIEPYAIDVQEHLIQMPFIFDPRTFSAQVISVLLAELFAPASDGFIADQNAARRHRLFDRPRTGSRSRPHRQCFLLGSVVPDMGCRSLIYIPFRGYLNLTMPS